MKQQIEKVEKRLFIRTVGAGLFHDSRKDIRTLSYVINELHKKIDELIDVVNEQQKTINNH